MRSVMAIVCLLLCSMVHAQQSEQTPEQKQRDQETLDAFGRLSESLTQLANATNAGIKEIKRSCLATGVSEATCVCLSYNIPTDTAGNQELWGDGAHMSDWVAYVTIITLPMTEAELLAKLKTPNAKKIVQTAFKARYKCN